MLTNRVVYLDLLLMRGKNVCNEKVKIPFSLNFKLEAQAGLLEKCNLERNGLCEFRRVIL